MNNIKKYIYEKLIINKNSTLKDIYCNSIQELSDKYDFNLFVSHSNTSWKRQQINFIKYKVFNDSFKTNISNKIVEVNNQELKQFANDLNYHFKDILDNKYTIELTNYINYDQVWGVIQIEDKNNKTIARALYDCIKSIIEFSVLKDEKETEKILSNVIDYIINDENNR